MPVEQSLPLTSFLSTTYLFQELMESKKVNFAHECSIAGNPTTLEMQYTAPMTRNKAKKLAQRAKSNAMAEGKTLDVFPNKKGVHDCEDLQIPYIFLKNSLKFGNYYFIISLLPNHPAINVNEHRNKGFPFLFSSQRELGFLRLFVV